MTTTMKKAVVSQNLVLGGVSARLMVATGIVIVLWILVWWSQLGVAA